MNFTAQAVSYLLSALLVFAWLREHRLRRSCVPSMFLNLEVQVHYGS
jgi:hypothetical protein